jgi:hypothetical protein
MSDLNQPPTCHMHNTEWESQHDKHHLAHPRPSALHASDRIAELETENSRLHRLVAELLLKNQQLRKPD